MPAEVSLRYLEMSTQSSTDVAGAKDLGSSSTVEFKEESETLLETG